jgi:hypothetical protein
MKKLAYDTAVVVAALPTAATALAGVIVRLSTDNKPYWCDGSAWVDLTSLSGITKAMVGLANADNTADTAKPLSTAQQTALNLKANADNPAITGNIVSAGGFYTTSPTAGIGYLSGAGGTVTQATSKATAVTLNKICGTITMNAASLAADTTVTFNLNNSALSVNDNMILTVIGAASASYNVGLNSIAAGTCAISVRNVTTGALAAAIAIRFSIIAGANA